MVHAGTASAFNAADVPAYSGKPYTAVNNNEPYFTSDDLTTEAFENYSELDALGRCGAAYANVCLETMPTEKRGSISEVKPTGWHSVKYDNVDGKSLYNRCHLIGYQLTAETAKDTTKGHRRCQLGYLSRIRSVTKYRRMRLQLMFLRCNNRKRIYVQ